VAQKPELTCVSWLPSFASVKFWRRYKPQTPGVTAPGYNQASSYLEYSSRDHAAKDSRPPKKRRGSRRARLKN